MKAELRPVGNIRAANYTLLAKMEKTCSYEALYLISFGRSKQTFPQEMFCKTAKKINIFISITVNLKT
jgi:hypothetical protein